MKFVIQIIGCLVLLSSTHNVYAADSTQFKPKTIKHYIRPAIYFNSYGTGDRKIIRPKDTLAPYNITQYRFSQYNLGFYLPLFTDTWYAKDSVTLSSLHTLLVGNICEAKPEFKGAINQHQFVKYSLGFRLFYNTGRKGVWFFDYSPFVSKDISYQTTFTVRSSLTAVYNRTVNEKFSYRLGITRTFLYGDGRLLPVIGLRIGRHDKLHFNLQVPRNLSLDIPIGQKSWLTLYAKPIGGIYNYYNTDTVLGTIYRNMQLRRKEVISGIAFEYKYNSNVSFNAGFGTSSKATIDLVQETRNGTRNFASYNLQKVGFITLGISARFGKAKKVNNNYELYDVFDMNNNFDAGDNNMGPRNNDIPKDPEKNKVTNIDYKDIEDLVTETDLN